MKSENHAYEDNKKVGAVFPCTIVRAVISVETAYAVGQY